MTKPWIFLTAALVLASALATTAEAKASGGPETVAVHNGSVTLHALIWRLEAAAHSPRSCSITAVAAHLMNIESAAHGQEARNTLQLKLLEGRDMSDALAGLAFLRALPQVDAHDVAVIGHSFGGSLTLLMAEREPSLRAVVIFSGSGYSWGRSPELRARLLTAVEHLGMPVFFIHAANDYSVASGKALDAELQQLGKPHLLKIYPPIGQTPDDGHAFPFLGVKIWEPDVFAFLDMYMRR